MNVFMLIQRWWTALKQTFMENDRVEDKSYTDNQLVQPLKVAFKNFKMKKIMTLNWYWKHINQNFDMSSKNWEWRQNFISSQ